MTRTMRTLKHLSAVLTVFLFSLIVINCEKTDVVEELNQEGLKSATVSQDFLEDGIVIYGPEEYHRGTGKPKVRSAEVAIENYEHFEETYIIVIESNFPIFRRSNYQPMTHCYTLFPVAVLIFLTTAAGAGIVAADLFTIDSILVFLCRGGSG